MVASFVPFFLLLRGKCQKQSWSGHRVCELGSEWRLEHTPSAPGELPAWWACPLGTRGPRPCVRLTWRSRAAPRQVWGLPGNSTSLVWLGQGGPGHLVLSSPWDRVAVRPGTTFENIPYVLFPNWSHDPFPKSRRMFPGETSLLTSTEERVFPSRPAAGTSSVTSGKRTLHGTGKNIFWVCVWVSSAQK